MKLPSFNLDEYASFECGGKLFLKLKGEFVCYFLPDFFHMLVNVFAVFADELITCNFSTTTCTPL